MRDMINKNLSHLPKVAEVVSEEKGDKVYAKLLVEAWAKKAQSKGPKGHAVEGTSMRHSMSGKCSRAIHYYLTGAEVTNLFDLPAYWATGLGTAIHEWWQDSLKEAFPNSEVEVICHVPKADSSGSADAVVHEDDGTLTVLELKSINGFGFKKIAESGDGPRHSDFIQLCVNAASLKADKAVLIYLSLEAVSKGRAMKFGLDEVDRIAKQFEWTREEFLPVANSEVSRWQHIREMGSATPRMIPDPQYPAHSVVSDPSKGLLMNPDGSYAGVAWNCGYCQYQAKCVEDCNGGGL